MLNIDLSTSRWMLSEYARAYRGGMHFFTFPGNGALQRDGILAAERMPRRGSRKGVNRPRASIAVAVAEQGRKEEGSSLPRGRDSRCRPGARAGRGVQRGLGQGANG